MWPIWPQFVKDYDHPEVLLAAGTAIFIGLQLFTAPFLGSLSDVLGRKPIFIITSIGTFIANLLLIPRNVYAYFSNRGADGLTNGVYSTVRSVITDLSSNKDLLRNMGLEGTIVSLGFILGPLIASTVLLGLDIEENEIVPVLIYTGISISFLNIILSALFKETLSIKKDKKIHFTQIVQKSVNPVRHIRMIASLNKDRPGLMNTVFLQICLTFSLGYYNYLITYISLGELQLNPKSISYFFTYFGIVFLITSYVFYTYIVHRINHTRFLIWASLAGILTHISYALIGGSPIVLYVVVTIDCLTIGLLPGLMDGLISRFTQSDDRGEIFGISQALMGLSSFLTTIVYGILSVISLQLPFYWFAICLIPLTLSNILLKKNSKKSINMKYRFIYGLILISLNAFAQIPVEVVVGHEQVQHEFFFFKDLDQNAKWNLFSMGRFAVDYEDQALNSSFISSQLTYNLNESWGLSSGGFYNEGDFAPILAVSYIYANESGNFFMNLFPTWIIKERAQFEMFGLVFFTPRINDRLNLFSQLIFGSTINHRFNQHLFSYQQIRLGLDFKGRFQCGFALDQNMIGGGELPYVYSNNTGLFVRKEL